MKYLIELYTKPTLQLSTWDIFVKDAISFVVFMVFIIGVVILTERWKTGTSK